MSEIIDKKIPSKTLDTQFYSRIRSTLSEERLILLEQFSESIPRPDLFGTFIDSNHYYETLKILNLATNEVRHLKAFLLSKILSQVKSFGHLLDIGIGDCSVTKIVGRKFKEITLIDKNKKIFKNISLSLFKKCSKLHLSNQCILDAPLERDKYDLILLSHTLYYIPKAQWPDLIKKLFSSLKKDGILFIALTGGLDKDGLIKTFSPTTPSIMNHLIDYCHIDAASKIEAYKSKEVSLSKDIKTMMHIANLYLNDAGVTVSFEDLKLYLLKKYHSNTGLFRLEAEQQFIVLQK